MISSRIVVTAAKQKCIVGVATKQVMLVATMSTGTLTTPLSSSSSRQEDDTKNWSNQLSFASPESDFTFTRPISISTSISASSSATTTVSNSTSSHWSNQLSFASPESDFTFARPISTSASSATVSNSSSNWSTQLSFASPESDFTSIDAREMSTSASSSNTNNNSNWTHQLSFASPESDFVGQLVPEASLLSAEERSRLRATNNESIVNTLLATVFGDTPLSQNYYQSNTVTLPKSFKEAIAKYQNEAVVITTAAAPHSIVYVNTAWERMCGYKAHEVLHKTLDCIQGPKTNTTLAQSTVQKLLLSMASPTSITTTTTKAPTNVEPVDMYLVNYRKDGSSFTNHITMGTMALNDDDESLYASSTNDTSANNFLVGILQEVSPDQVPLRMI